MNLSTGRLRLMVPGKTGFNPQKKRSGNVVMTDQMIHGTVRNRQFLLSERDLKTF